MRSFIALFAAVTASACATDLADGPPPPPDTMRARLAESARLLVTADESGGTLTAERKVAGTDRWEGGLVDLGIENGELVVTASSDEELTLEALQITFDPLDLPAGLVGAQHAQLKDVRIDLTAEQTLPATWTSENEVLLAANLDLTLTWKLALDGAPAPLGSPRLPKVPVAIVLTGNGAHMQAEIRAQSPGELWAWAGLVKLRDLALVMGATL